MEQRDRTRDAVRGLNALEMTFVNISNIGWSNHSGYIDQPRYADTIFPFFAFLNGMSPSPARRAVGLVGLGLGLNALHSYSKGDVFRIPGVLQRLGLASLVVNEPIFSCLRIGHGFPLILLWYAISVGLAGTTNPFAHADYIEADPTNTAQTRIDHALFGNHIYTPTHDPEGLLGALTTAVSMLIGREFISSRNISVVAKTFAASGMIAAGELLHILSPKFAPLSKGLWTPSFVLVTSGYSIIKYLAAQHVIPLLPAELKSFLDSTGRRSLEVYVLSTILELALLHGGSMSLWNQALSCLTRLTSRTMADLIMSTAFTGIIGCSAWLMVRHSIRLNW